jgi:hypothetical protein
MSLFIEVAMPSNAVLPPFQPGLDAQLSFMTELTRSASDSIRKLNELNRQFAQQLMQDALDATTGVLSCPNPFQLAATASHAAQPSFTHVRQYQEQLVNLLSGSQLDLARKPAAVPPEASRPARDMASSMSRANGAGDSAQGAS